MASEATISSTLSVPSSSGYRRTATFKADVADGLGPSPAMFLATLDGTDVDFGQLITPGIAWLSNLEPVGGAYVQWGFWIPALSKFLPLGEIRPGESFPFRFARDLGEEFAGTGTGTSAPINTVRFKAAGGPAHVLVEAFEMA